MNLFFICVFAISVSSNLTFSQEYKQQMDITKKIIGHFEANEIEEIYDYFNDTMKAAITKDKLTEIWNLLPLQCGAYLGHGESIASEVQGMIVVNQLLDFETIDLDIRLAFDEDNQISGFFFVPPVKKK